jgi:hypothetical protein
MEAVVTVRRIGDLPEPGRYVLARPTCHHAEHNPPTHMVLRPGIYEHTCPGCGVATMFTVHGGAFMTWVGT